ncbi:MAG: sodium:proton antiporter [Rhodospirillaceae bacterium]|nr:sodium:proton antiporter [Rhodospirillales bacterium]
MANGVLVYVLAVVVAGMGIQWLGWRFRIPPIVFLLAAGLALGPVLGVLHPAEDLGHLLHPLVGLAVAIIVYEGGLNLSLAELRAAGKGVTRLVLLALPLNWIFGTLAAGLAGGLPWPVAALVGAMLTVTGPTVILPLLRHARLNRRTASLFKWEAVVNDPLGAILTVVVLQMILEGARTGSPAGAVAWLVPALAAAVLAGGGMAYGVRTAFRADMVPEVLRLPLLIALALGLYAAGNALYPESGLIGATAFGLVLANLQMAGLKQLMRTQESLTLLVVSSLFIILAADIRPTMVEHISWRLVTFVAAIMLVARPLSIMLATIGAGLDWRERLLLAWVAPRGIVAAAISGIAGAQLSASGQPGGPLVLPMVFSVIVVTVLVQGLTLEPLARWLGLKNSERPGLLVVGMSPWALALCQALHRDGVPVVLADRSWQALRPAREAEIPTAAVEVLSGWIDEIIEASGVDYVLAASDDDSYNALVCAKLAPELGRERVSQLAWGSGRLDEHSMPGRDWRGELVADPGFDHATAHARLDEGWVFHIRSAEERRPATEEETPLLVIHQDGSMRFHSPEHAAHSSPGDLLVVFRRAAPTPVVEPDQH